MRFVNKDNLIKDLQMFRYLLDEKNNPTVKFTEKQMKAVCQFIEHYREDECILCDADYWLNDYNIFTREWKFEDESRPPQTSFIISRKTQDEAVENNVDTIKNEEDIKVEEDARKEQLNE